MSDTIAEGREAWAQLKGGQRKSFDLWLTIGRALAIGRTQAMRTAGCNVPHGKRYNAALGVFLEANGFADIQPAARYQIANILENLPAVMKWREALPEEQRVKINHPESVWHHYLKYSKDKRYKVPQSRRNIHKPEPGPKSPQDRLRYVATALRENWTNDVMRMAVIACNAVDEFDKPPPPKLGRPAKSEEQRVSA